MKTYTIEVSLTEKDFAVAEVFASLAKKAEEIWGIDDVLALVEAEIDGDGEVYLLDVQAEKSLGGADLLTGKVLTKECKQRLEEKIYDHASNITQAQMEAAYDSWVDSQIDEWKERRRG